MTGRAWLVLFAVTCVILGIDYPALTLAWILGAMLWALYREAGHE